MRILFLTDNFPPEVNAPANRTYEHCREWVNQGVEVTVITCAPNFPKGKVYNGYKNRLLRVEYIDGIKVIRVWTYITANEGFAKRTLDYFSFGLMSFLIGLFVKTNVIIATSPQFFSAISARSLSFFKMKPWVMEVRDLWPDSIVAVGAMQKGCVIQFLKWIEHCLYKSATRIVVVTDSFKRIINERGIDSSKIIVHKNGVDLKHFQISEKDYLLLDQLKLRNKFIIAYIGTHGMAHGLSFVLRSIQKFNNVNSLIHFLFIGDGAERDQLIELKNELGITNVSFIPSVPKSEVKQYWSIIDVALVNLKKSQTFQSVIPSKIFEAAAMQKPILLGLTGESKEIIEGYNAGLCYEPENESDFLEKINRIAEQDNYTKFQEGCKKLSSHFDRKIIALQMLETIRTCHK